MLKYAQENGCPWNEGTCVYAAFRGHLDVLQYLHENGCPWDEGTCKHAAYGGHLDVLKCAHENGCPWNALTCYCAARRGHLAVLEYASQHGCPWNKQDCLQGLAESDEVMAHAADILVAWTESQPDHVGNDVARLEHRYEQYCDCFKGIIY